MDPTDLTLSLARWRVGQAATKVIADKLNSIVNSHDEIVSAFAEWSSGPEDILRKSAEELEHEVRQAAKELWAER